jgi:hypothetical protein
MDRKPPEGEVPSSEALRKPELGRREFLSKSAVAAVAAVGVPALLGACDSGSVTDAEEQRNADVGAPRMAEGRADPWLIVHEKIAHTIGHGADVKIPALEKGSNGFIQRVVTDSDRTGTGLATVMRRSYKFVDSSGASVYMTVSVEDGNGRPWPRRTVYKQSDLVYAMKDALASNTLADGVLRESLETGKPIVAIFKSSVVQFQASVASDYYGNHLQVFSRAASDLFNTSVGGYPLAATTRDFSRC